MYIYAGSKVDKGVDNLNVMVSTDTLEGGVEGSSTTCNFVLLQLIFLVQFVKTPRVVFLEQELVFPTCWPVWLYHKD